MRPATRAAAVLLSLVLCLAAAGAAGTEGVQALVRVWFDGADGAAFFAAHPDLDVVQVKPGVAAEIVAGEADLARLRASGLRLEIVHKDLVAHYAARVLDKSTNFGGWHTYGENIAFLDSLRAEYPQRISAKWSIGQSHQGRDIWCVRLSSDPDVAQPEKPEILLMTMIHAREIMAGDFGLMLADHLCSNYGTDPVVTWLLDNRELYLVSILNPDGVVHNELTNPAGGGLWRKNRRVNGDGTYGVDLNRNFPFEWVGSGSSTNPASEIYRGPSPGSEPETQALMALVNGRQFFAAQDLHTYSNLTLYPWGYTTGPTPEAELFAHMGQIMVQYNGYAVGQPGQLLYNVNGGSIDWLYGATGEHPKIYAFCNEMGSSSDGFWPDYSRRDALFQENLWPMLYLMMAAGAYAEVADAVATDAGGGLLEPGDSGLLTFTVRNLGVTESLAALELTLSCDDPYIQLASASRSLGVLAPRGEVAIAPPFEFTVDPACPTGRAITVTVRCELPGGALDYPLTFVVGEPVDLFFDDFSAGTASWTLTDTWGLTSATYVSAPSSLTDSPDGNYSNYQNATATLAGAYRASRLEFWHRYDIETGYDYGRVQVSAGGGPWQTVVSYTGAQAAWRQVELDLGAYAGQELSLRFLLQTDYSVVHDGWYIDNVRLIGAGGTDQAPPPPLLLSPAPGAVLGGPVVLSVGDVDDPEGEPVTYGFRIYTDPLLTQVAAAADGVPQGEGGQTDWLAPALTEGGYWWRAYAAGGDRRGLFGETRSLVIDASTGVEVPLGGGPRLLVLGQGGGRAEVQLLLPQGADATVRIYSARGLLVRELFQGRLESGARSLFWDGRDGRGRQAASGVYLVRAQVGEASLGGRVVLVR